MPDEKTELEKLRSLCAMLEEANAAWQDENQRLSELVWDMVRWMPCRMPCRACERYRHLEGCEFDIRRKELGVGF